MDYEDQNVRELKHLMEKLAVTREQTEALEVDISVAREARRESLDRERTLKHRIAELMVALEYDTYRFGGLELGLYDHKVASIKAVAA